MMAANVPAACSIPVENSNLAAANSLSELAHSVKEKGLWIFGETDSKRRVITIEKKDGSYGFTLQSYGVRYKHGNRETDFITYVNAVEKDGAAFHAGLREGDAILSINGQNMARMEHASDLVNFIRTCPTHLKMVVISDERARKVELHMRYVHLQKKLQDKMQELEQLNKAEQEILNGTFKGHASDLLGGSCLPDAASACCFCPTKSKGFLEDKEKSKSIDRVKTKDLQYEYDFYRKSQSTKELSSSEQTNTSGSIVGIQSAKKTQSGGDLNSFSSGAGTLATPSTSTAHCLRHNSQSSSHRKSSGASAIGDAGANASSSSGSKPKSWDNLMTTKSFGGYGFGFGYGYYPNKGVGHYHFSHPHHHNHHTHCSNHPHQSYYYQSGSKPPRNMQASGAGSRRSSIESEASARPFSNCTTYKMVGTTRVVARVTMGNIDTPAGAYIRTLPTSRPSSSSRQTPDTASFTSKLEKTLSDSSLNSEFHKDFPKSMSYFSKASDNDGQVSSEDEYDEYATDSVRKCPENDIYV